MSEKIEAPKTLAQLQDEYSELAKRCTACAVELPRIKKKIQQEVERRYASELKKLDELKAAKRAAYIAMQKAMAEQSQLEAE
jgi:hypothetical protein